MLSNMGSMDANAKACFELYQDLFGGWNCSSYDLTIDLSQAYLEHLCFHHCLDLNIGDVVQAIDLMSFVNVFDICLYLPPSSVPLLYV